MKISTRSRYAARLMLYLAEHSDEGAVKLNYLAKEEDISMKYLSQIVIYLKNGGLINADRGSNGGYYLKRESKDITMLEIIELTEGNLSITDCTETNSCIKKPNCATHILWNILSKTIKNKLQEISLADLVKWHKEERKDIEEYLNNTN